MAEPVQGPALQTARYRRPPMRGPRGIVRLGGTGDLNAVVQVLEAGARQGLHAHGNYDGVYLGLSGRTRFYGEGGRLFVEIGPNEIVIVPKGATYGFEAVGGPSELFYVNAVDRAREPAFFVREEGAQERDYDLFDPDGHRMGAAE
jgi:mannose-6-phosphate isomerase-like protein (cupin superfamily)